MVFNFQKNMSSPRKEKYLGFKLRDSFAFTKIIYSISMKLNRTNFWVIVLFRMFIFSGSNWKIITFFLLFPTPTKHQSSISLSQLFGISSGRNWRNILSCLTFTNSSKFLMNLVKEVLPRFLECGSTIPKFNMLLKSLTRNSQVQQSFKCLLKKREFFLVCKKVTISMDSKNFMRLMRNKSY